LAQLFVFVVALLTNSLNVGTDEFVLFWIEEHSLRKRDQEEEEEA